ncbi:MAG: DNA recombination and repair protein RecO [Cytophagales bacterium]|jgi:DNA repair protein RecO (recombination protein O)|nr:DNA repair protein RecO [Bacteroidota bacterium]MBS1980006.1 DNA repair protein RecO [Bacteroidota bacterium]WHZ07245.1 MAG: DNA recombination and repair protein RecO [Cytophagales bacterium]
MLHKTQGIVFRLTNYSETSIIVTIFTGAFGLQSYIVNGVRGKSKKTTLALYQPLTLLDLVVYHKENASILRIKDVKCVHPYQHIPHDFKKSAIALFLNEVINKTVKEQTHAHELCEFLIQSFISLDWLEKNIENFHLIFLIRLSQHLGFRPTSVNELSGGWVTSDEEEKIISALLVSGYSSTIIMSRVQRKNILDILLRFYAVHSENFGEVKSLSVLREIIQ